MDRELISWLNSATKDFASGRVILKRLRKEHDNLPMYERGATEQNKVSLFNDLRTIYYELKGIEISIKKSNPIGLVSPVVSAPIENISTPVQDVSAPAPVKNDELLKSCKLDADNAFKKMMTTKAVLFSMCDTEKRPNENTADIVQARSILAFDILEQHSEMKRLYDVYEYVQEHGKLPDEKPIEMAPLPSNPVLLERMRTNIMKNISKLKKKEQTTSRIALIQQHEETLNRIKDVISRI